MASSSAQDSWVLSPARRALLELTKFRYLFGNTRHQSFYRDTGDKSTNRIALLGFGDLRNAWATLEAATASTTSKKKIEIDLVDIESANVARGVLLDYLAQVLDVSTNEEDALFLWGVTYCAEIPAEWLSRLQFFVQNLIADADNESSNFKKLFAIPQDAAAVLSVLKSWASDSLNNELDADKILEKRRQHNAHWISFKMKEATVHSPSEVIEIDPKWEESFGAMAIQIASGWKTGNEKGAEIANTECLHYLKTGSIYPDNKLKTLSGKDMTHPMVANPTLLDPGTLDWNLHYGSAPFLCYLPLSPAAEAIADAAIVKKSSRPLTNACFQEFKTLVAARRTAGTAAKLRFWLGDAIELCTNSGSTTGLPLKASSSIDTSNLGDKIGLLNILVACQPLLLSNNPAAALFTTSMAWGTSKATSISEFLDLAGIEVKLAPTLLGLRLLSTPEFGRETPRAVLQTMCSDVLIWQPVSSRAGGGGGVERVSGVLPAPSELETCDSVYKYVAKHTAKLCALPEDLELQWQALCCWCFGSGENKKSASSNVVPVIASWKVAPTAAFKIYLKGFGHIPLLHVNLSAPKGNKAAIVAAFLSGAAEEEIGASMMVHNRLDIVGFDCKTMQTRCLLPPGTDYTNNGGIFCLLDGPALLANPSPITKLEKMKHTPPPRLARDAWLAVDSASDAAAEKLSSLRGVRILKAVESLSGFMFSFELPDEISMKANSTPQITFGATSGEDKDSTSSRFVEVSLPVQTKPSTSSSTTIGASLLLPWPVEKSKYLTQIRPLKSKESNSSNKSTLSLMFTKSFIWPEDANPAVLNKISVVGLPIAKLQNVGSHMGRMFSLKEGMAKVHGTTSSLISTGTTSKTLFDLKETVQALFVRSLQLEPGGGRVMHSLFSADETVGEDNDEASLAIFIHGIYNLPDGRPIAHMSCMDHKVAYSLYPTESLRMGAVERFSKVMKETHAAGRIDGTNRVRCAPGEIEMLRNLIARNAQRLNAPAWQKKLIRGGQEWQASYITPLYSDIVVQDYDLIEGRDVGARGVAGEGVPGTTRRVRAPTARAAPAPAAGRQDTSCSVCGKSEAMKCARCKKVYFSSTKCQKLGWPEHKKTCKPA